MRDDVWTKCRERKLPFSSRYNSNGYTKPGRVEVHGATFGFS